VNNCGGKTGVGGNEIRNVGSSQVWDTLGLDKIVVDGEVGLKIVVWLYVTQLVAFEDPSKSNWDMNGKSLDLQVLE